jgi:CubicO group peptidase (beta-lactamase class C family)
MEQVVRHILSRKFPHIHGLLVLKNDRLVLEEYFYGYGPQDPHPVQSVTKSVFSLLFGIAEGQGLLGRSKKLFDYYPASPGKGGWDPRKDQITLENLLTMTSGLGCDDTKDSDSCSWAMVSSSDWLNFSLSLPIREAPGTHFAYCGACLTPLGALLEDKSGLKLPQYAQKYLLGPLGIQAPLWWEGPGNTHSPAFGLALTPREMAKIGCLVLDKGKWKGRQVVPEDWILKSTFIQVPARKTGKEAGYGYLWWVREAPWHGKKLRVLDAWGVGGQHIFIVPGLNLVCVLTGGNYKEGGLNHSFEVLREVMDSF